MTVDALDISKLFYRPQVGPWTTTQPALPGIPQNLGGTVAATSVILFWDAVAGATGYEYRVDGGSAQSVDSGESQNITGLTTDQEYDFQVRAVNALGAGAWSTPISRTPVASGGSSLVSIALTWALLNANGGGRFSFVFDFNMRTSTGDFEFLVQRTHGTQGAVSVQYASSGDAHTSTSGTLNWIDGDASVQKVVVPCPSKPANGIHQVVLTLHTPSGGVLHHGIYTRAYGLINDNTVAPNSNAVFFNTALGSSGDGTIESPFNNYYEAVAAINGTTKRHLYGRGTIVPDGTHSSVPYGISGQYSLHSPSNRTSDSERVYVMSWPGFSLTIDGTGQTNTCGFFNNGNASYCTYLNISFTNLITAGAPGLGIWYHYGTYGGIHVINCNFNNIDGNENNGGVNLYGCTIDCKVWNCNFANIKKEGDTNNGNTGGVYSYSGNYISVQRCTFAATMSRGIFHKRTEAGFVSIRASFNIFNDCQCYYGISGGGNPGHFGILVSDNIFIGPSASVHHLSITVIVGTGENQISNNYFYLVGVGVEGCVENWGGEDLLIFANIIDTCNYVYTDQQSDAGDLPQIIDYNVVVNLQNNWSAINFSARSLAQTNSDQGTSYGANEVNSGLNTVDAANDDFHNNTGSSALTAAPSGGIAGPYRDPSWVVGYVAA